MRWVAPYLGRHKAIVVVALVAAGFWTVALVTAPLLQKVIVDDAIIAHSKPVLPWVAALALMVALRAATSGLWREAGGRLSIHVQNDIRDDLYAHLQRLDAAAHERMQSGQLIARVNSDLVLIQQVVGLLPPVLGTVLAGRTRDVHHGNAVAPAGVGAVWRSGRAWSWSPADCTCGCTPRPGTPSSARPT